MFWHPKRDEQQNATEADSDSTCVFKQTKMLAVRSDIIGFVVERTNE